jgi:hypothetical protein
MDTQKEPSRLDKIKARLAGTLYGSGSGDRQRRPTTRGRVASPNQSLDAGAGIYALTRPLYRHLYPALSIALAAPQPPIETGDPLRFAQSCDEVIHPAYEGVDANKNLDHLRHYCIQKTVPADAKNSRRVWKEFEKNKQ